MVLVAVVFISIIALLGSSSRNLSDYYGRINPILNDSAFHLAQWPFLFSSNVWHNATSCKGLRIYIPHLSHITEYSVVIQSALRAIRTIGGGSVMLEHGIYFIDKPIELSSNTCFIGAGSGRTFIKLSNHQSKFPNPGILRVIRAEHTSMIGFTMDGNMYNQGTDERFRQAFDGIDIFLSERVTIRDVGVVNVRGNAMNLRGDQNRILEDFSLDEVHLSRNAGPGIHLVNVTSVRISASQILQNKFHGIYIDNAKNIVVRDTYIKMSSAEWNACGIYCTHSVDSVLLERVDVVGAPFAGICSNASNLLFNDSMIVNMDNEESSCFSVSNKKQLGILNSTCDVLSLKVFAE